MAFSKRDFDCFHEKNWRNKEFNEYRLNIRRKLLDIGKKIQPKLKKQGVAVTAKTSLHHPYTHNNYAVRSQWVYFSPDKKSMAPLKMIMGSAFFKELDSHYTHTLLVLGIEHEHMNISLKVHEQAWWDGQNLKNKCEASSEQRGKLLQILLPLDGFLLGIHDWKKRYQCDKITPSDVQEFIKYYTPGKHWLHLDYNIPREKIESGEIDIVKKAEELLPKLSQMYNFIIWSPENNYVFTKKQSS